MDTKASYLKQNKSFIYFMTERDLFGYPCGPYVKIGLVKGNDDGRSSFERRKEHQTGNPREIIIEAEVELVLKFQPWNLLFIKDWQSIESTENGLITEKME